MNKDSSLEDDISLTDLYSNSNGNDNSNINSNSNSNVNSNINSNSNSIDNLHCHQHHPFIQETPASSTAAAAAASNLNRSSMTAAVPAMGDSDSKAQRQRSSPFRRQQEASETGSPAAVHAAAHAATTGGHIGGIHSNSKKGPAFPWVLRQLLNDADGMDFADIISWNSDGKSFKVHKRSEFSERIMPAYFNQSRYKSFQRQLNIYGFTRVTKGALKGVVHHPLFVQGNSELCSHMKRRRFNKADANNESGSDGHHLSEPGYNDSSSLDMSSSAFSAGGSSNEERADGIASGMASLSDSIPGPSSSYLQHQHTSRQQQQQQASSGQGSALSMITARSSSNPARSSGPLFSATNSMSLSGVGATDSPQHGVIPSERRGGVQQQQQQQEFLPRSSSSALLDQSKLKIIAPDIADEIIRTFCRASSDTTSTTAAAAAASATPSINMRSAPSRTIQDQQLVQLAMQESRRQLRGPPMLQTIHDQQQQQLQLRLDQQRLTTSWAQPHQQYNQQRQHEGKTDDDGNGQHRYDVDSTTFEPL